MDTSNDQHNKVDLVALARQQADLYVGPTDTVDDLICEIVHLAAQKPGQARQLVESIAAAADDAMHGKHTEQVDSVEQLVLQSLGLQAENLFHAEAALSDPDAFAGRAEDGEPTVRHEQGREREGPHNEVQ